eukprot:Blabericola_migrator_1__3132@NODE_1914_length_3569_cov_204_173901_g1207_i1_p4_GENE_NODE_1914_length_3569_cov_204_173901_g1207_i1NODE_1914_length_3569_cov_204_173901_g1207_i1_p4_ORF_typecomplete_len121_score13_83_NODE_1914_length_3569_cov_204_173901_g1207_i111011463
MRPSTKTGDLQSPPAHNDIRTQTTPRLDHRHWNSPRPHIHQPTLVMPLPGDPPPREWVTLIDFSALRRYEGKVILVDSTLESPSSYTPKWHDMQVPAPSPTAAGAFYESPIIELDQEGDI